MTSRLARDYGLKLQDVGSAMDVISSGVRRCIFTMDDLSPDFFDLKNRIAGDVFQKLVNYNCKIAIVLPPDHGLGARVEELSREHVNHPFIRFFPSVELALDWND